MEKDMGELDHDGTLGATFVSVWDGGHEVASSCEVDAKTHSVTSIETVDVEGLDLTTLDREYVIMPDGDTRDLVCDAGGYRVASAVPVNQIGFAPEIDELDDKLNFVLDATYDLDEAFGIDVMSLDLDEIAWASVNYDIRSGKVEAEVSVEIHHDDGGVDELARWLTEGDREALLEKMEAHCIECKGKTLAEYGAEVIGDMEVSDVASLEAAFPEGIADEQRGAKPDMVR